MKAAVVTDFQHAPRYEDRPSPAPAAGEVRVSVKAAALSQLVKGQAAGRHYSSGSLPFVPGVDGVGRLPDGRRVYFAFPRAPHGSMAEETVIAPESCVDLPDGVDDVTAAAIANPGMSSWAALTERAHFERGETVLVNGATGASGRLAVQIARHLGAKRVIATGRNAASVAPLAALGADALIPLDQPPEALRAAFKAELSRGLDVVLDYLWGASAEQLLAAFSGHGAPQGEPRVRFVQIGSLSGANISLPGALLRSSGVELLGSGLGSVPVSRLLESIRGVMGAVLPAGLSVSAEAIPLRDVNAGWGKATASRVVFTV